MYLAVEVASAHTEANCRDACADWHIGISCAALHKLRLEAEVLDCFKVSFNDRIMFVKCACRNVNVVLLVECDCIHAPACCFFEASFCKDSENLSVKLVELFLRIGTDVILDCSLLHDSVDTCIVTSVEVGNAEDCLRVIWHLKVGNLCYCACRCVERVCNLAECAHCVTALAVEVSFASLHTCCLINDTAYTAAVDVEIAVDVVVIAHKVADTAEAAHTFFTSCAHKDDVALCLDIHSVENADNTQNCDTAACIVADTRAVNDAVFNLDFLCRATWENCIHVAFDNDFLTAACALSYADSVVVLVNVAIFKAELLEAFYHPVCSVKLVACWSFDEAEFALLLDLEVFFILDEFETVLYFVKLCNCIDNALDFIGCYIRHI